MRRGLSFEPVAITGFVQAALLALVGFGWLEWAGIDSKDSVMLLVGVLTAAGALYTAYRTSRTLLAPLVELFKAVAAAATIYGFHLSAEDAALVVAVFTAGAGLFHQSQVSPLAKGSFSLAA